MLRRFLLIVACVLLGGIICLSSQEGEPAVSPAAVPRTIAVIDFANLSDSYVPGIEETAAEILSTLLAQTENSSFWKGNESPPLCKSWDLCIRGWSTKRAQQLKLANSWVLTLWP